MKDPSGCRTERVTGCSVTAEVPRSVSGTLKSAASARIAFAAPAPMRAKRDGAPVPLVAGTIETAADVAATFAIAP